MIDEKKERAITMILEGTPIIDIAKILGVNRGTIYNWLENEEFKNELGRRKQEIATQGNNLILSELSAYIKELKKIALHGKSEKVRSDTAAYLVNRILGNTTTKIEQTTEDKTTDKTSEADILAVFEDSKEVQDE